MANESWEKLEKLLAEINWPEVYTFKFISPNDEQKLMQLQKLFDRDTAKVSLKSSSGGNYISFTVKEMMMSAEAVIDRYKQAGEIEGLIPL